MSISSLFNAGSIGADPGLFEDVLNSQDYSQVFGDTSTSFGNTTDLFGSDNGWNFVDPGNSNVPDFSNIFNSPAPGGLSFSQGFNSSENLFDPSKGLTFDSGSLNKLELILDDVAQGDGKPRNLYATTNSSAIGIGQRQRERNKSAALGSLNPVNKSTSTVSTITPRNSALDRFRDFESNPNIRRGMEFLMGDKYRQSFGLPPMTRAQASAYLGNAYVETGGLRNLDVVEKGSGRGRGLLQYTGARRGPYDQFASKLKAEELNDIDRQLEYAGQEWRNKDLIGWTKALNKIPDDPTQATLHLRKQYYRPGVPHDDRRIQASNRIFEYMGLIGR